MNIRLIELFAGIGAQAKALERLGVDFEHYRVCEFDKYAVQSYNAIHGTNFEPSDIRELKGSDLGIVETNENTYIMTYSFPCQDLSNAGKGRGMTKGSGTRSGLLWEVERLLNETENLPQILLMENVTQVHSKKNLEDWKKWLLFLESKGYSNYFEDLNAKDFGIPQSRNRCFMVSFLDDDPFYFPEGKPLKYKVKDFLEDQVDSKYYISETLKEGLIRASFRSHKPSFIGEDTKTTKTIDTRTGGSLHWGQYVNIKQATKEGSIPCEIGGVADLSFPESETRRGRVIEDGNVCPTILTGNDGIVRIESPTIGAMRGRNPENPNSRKAGEKTVQRLEVNEKGLCNTLTTVQKDNLLLEPVLVGGFGEKCNKGKQFHNQNRVYSADAISTAVTTDFRPYYSIKSEGFRSFEQAKKTFEDNDCSSGDLINPFNETVNSSGISPTITTRPEGFKTAILPVVEDLKKNLRIRKLTPRECYRLMGFDDEDFDQAEKVVSNSQLYKQAGNSIVVNVLEAIFENVLSHLDNHLIQEKTQEEIQKKGEEEMFEEGTEKRVQELIKKEYEKAIATYGEFHSMHEGFSVLKEELEEAKLEERLLDDFVEFYWDSIKKNSFGHCVNALLEAKERVERQISELAQVGAMINKNLDIFKKEEEK